MPFLNKFLCDLPTYSNETLKSLMLVMQTTFRCTLPSFHCSNLAPVHSFECLVSFPPISLCLNSSFFSLQNLRCLIYFWQLPNAHFPNSAEYTWKYPQPECHWHSTPFVLYAARLPSTAHLSFTEIMFASLSQVPARKQAFLGISTGKHY